MKKKLIWVDEDFKALIKSSAAKEKLSVLAYTQRLAESQKENSEQGTIKINAFFRRII